MNICGSTLQEFKSLWNAQFREEDHPRDSDGKFTDGSGTVSRKLFDKRSPTYERKVSEKVSEADISPVKKSLNAFGYKITDETLSTTDSGTSLYLIGQPEEDWKPSVKLRLSDHPTGFDRASREIQGGTPDELLSNLQKYEENYERIVNTELRRKLI